MHIYGFPPVAIPLGKRLPVQCLVFQIELKPGGPVSVLMLHCTLLLIRKELAPEADDNG